MRRHHLRRSLAASAATALLLSLAGCGDDATSDEPASADGTSAPADQPAEGEVVDNADFVDDMMAGIEASTTARMTMNMDFGGGSMDLDGEVDYTTEPVSMAVEMTQEAMGEQALSMVLVDGSMYMNMGQMTNDKFVEFDLSDPASLPPGMGDLGEQLDPLAAFEQFEPALKTVTFAGTEDVDGDDLHHYEVVMDAAKLEALEDLPAGAGVPEDIGYDLWFDDEFRIRQMEMVMDIEPKVTVEAQLSDWGQPVDIEAPSADEIAEQPSA